MVTTREPACIDWYQPIKIHRAVNDGKACLGIVESEKILVYSSPVAHFGAFWFLLGVGPIPETATRNHKISSTSETGDKSDRSTLSPNCRYLLLITAWSKVEIWIGFSPWHTYVVISSFNPNKVTNKKYQHICCEQNCWKRHLWNWSGGYDLEKNSGWAIRNRYLPDEGDHWDENQGCRWRPWSGWYFFQGQECPLQYLWDVSLPHPVF